MRTIKGKIFLDLNWLDDCSSYCRLRPISVCLFMLCWVIISIFEYYYCCSSHIPRRHCLCFTSSSSSRSRHFTSKSYRKLHLYCSPLLLFHTYKQQYKRYEKRWWWMSVDGVCGCSSAVQLPCHVDVADAAAAFLT